MNDEETDGKQCLKDMFPKGLEAYNLVYNSTIEKDSIITVGYFEGTTYTEVEMKADVWFVYAPDVVLNSDDFELSKDGYAYLTIPDDLLEGYYCLSYFDDKVGYRQFWFYVE